MNDDEAEAIAATFGLGALRSPPTLAARGANGFIWKITTDRGEYAVKRLQPWISDDPRPFDVGFQLAAADAGVPLPRPVLTERGEAVISATRVYEWVDLAAPFVAPVAPSLAAEVGAILGRLHALGITPPGEVDRWFLEPPARELWTDLVRRGNEAGTWWAETFADELEFLVDVGRRVAVPRSGPCIACHNDFWPDNVPPSARDGSPIVLDWENAGPMTADSELAGALLEWVTDGDRVDLDAAAALVDAYRAVAGAVTIEPASFHMEVVANLNYLKTLGDHSLDPELASEFTDTAIRRLAPERLRLRLGAIERLLAGLR